MKRLTAAVLLLLCVIAAGWYNLHTLSSVVQDIAEPLTQAVQAAEQDHMSDAAIFLRQSHEIYQGKETYLSAVASEKLLDEVRLGFARTEQTVKDGKPEDLTPELAALQQAVADLLRSEAMNLKNIL